MTTEWLGTLFGCVCVLIVTWYFNRQLRQSHIQRMAALDAAGVPRLDSVPDEMATAYWETSPPTGPWHVEFDWVFSDSEVLQLLRHFAATRDTTSNVIFDFDAAVRKIQSSTATPHAAPRRFKLVMLSELFPDAGHHHSPSGTPPQAS
jgi:hypothetical protein